MTASFEGYVAVRYLLARRKQAFVSLISLISTLGLTVGVMATIVALALMTGLQQEMRDRLLGAQPHVYVWKLGSGGYLDYHEEAGRMRTIPGVVSAAPSIIGRALASSRHGEAFITVKGVDPELESQVTEVAVSVQQGSFDDLATRDGPRDGIVIGEGVAEDLGAFVGDQITLVTPHGALGPMGMMPRRRRFEIVGIFRLGLYEYDNAFGFVTLDVGQASRCGGPSPDDGASGRMTSTHRARSADDRRSGESGTRHIVTLDWTEMNQSLFSALWLEKMAIVDHDRPDCDGCRAQYRCVARVARHGEEPRHRYPQDHGGESSDQRHEDFHAARD